MLRNNVLHGFIRISRILNKGEAVGSELMGRGRGFHKVLCQPSVITGLGKFIKSIELVLKD